MRSNLLGFGGENICQFSSRSSKSKSKRITDKHHYGFRSLCRRASAMTAVAVDLQRMRVLYRVSFQSKMPQRVEALYLKKHHFHNRSLPRRCLHFWREVFAFIFGDRFFLAVFQFRNKMPTVINARVLPHYLVL